MVWMKNLLGNNAIFQVDDVAWGGAVFVRKGNLSLAEIPDEFVEMAKNKMFGCCGNEKRPFVVASPEEVERWKNE